MNVAFNIADARAPDPTGTAGLRRSFRAAGKLRLQMFRSQMRQAVVDHDVLGLGGGGLALQPPETRLQAFGGWARVAAEQALGGPWLSQWIARAWASGEAVGALQTRSEAPGEGSGAWEELAKIELAAIEAAVIQALTREAAVALTKRRANKVMTWRRMAKAFDKVGPRRIMALANTFCVACHNRGRLAAYRAAGITKVGVIPERLLPKQALLLPGGLGDRRRVHDAKHKGYRELGPARPEYTLGEVEEPIEVGVRTAGDEFVCIECDAFAANSPHDIDDVEDTLPIHPNCRCTWFPWDDKRFKHDAEIDDARKQTKREDLLAKLGRKRHRLLASLCPRQFENRYLREDSWNPFQPREPAGTSEGGQFASITGGGISGGATGGPVGTAKKLFTPSSDKAHHEKRVSDTLLNPVKRNDNYRYVVGKLIDEAKGHGASAGVIGELRSKIGESFYKQGLVKKEKGDEDFAQKMFAKGKSYGYNPTVGEAMAAMAAPVAKPETVEPELTSGAEPGTPAYEGEQAATIPVAMPAWKKLGGQKGSVAGGTYGDPQGNTWYVKTPKTEAHVNADLLSNALYKMAGVPVSDQVKTVLEGKPAVASKFIEQTKTLGQAASTSEAIDAHNKLKEGFAVDAWLGNRDVIGEGYDNVLIGHATPYRIDQGGTLMYRAQGETKPFGVAVDEITSMRSKEINPQTWAVFGSMTDAEVSASIDKVLAIPESTIMKAAIAHGMPSVAATLIARRNWLQSYQKTLDVPGSKPKPWTGEGEPQEAWMTAMETKSKAAAQPKPTAAELEKAKKVGPYYPAPTSEMGKVAVKHFNEKWATKTPEAHELEEKVADYKNAKAAIEAIQKEAAEQLNAAVVASEAAAKEKAATAKAQAKAAIAAAKAKAEAESAKHQAALAEIATELGLSPNDADQVDTLISLAGGDKAKIVQQFKAFQESGQGKHGLPITPFESAMIQSYVGSAYGSANRQLREGAWDMKTHVFAAAIQKALTKLPAYNEVLKRGFSAKEPEQVKYEVGKIVHWNAFSSCGKSNSFGGNMQCTITPLPGNVTRARDLGPMNPTEAGGEVLFMAKSSFKVTKVIGVVGGTMEIHLQEVESF